MLGNPEDPQGNDGINQHFHTYHVNDEVVHVAGGDRSYSNSPTTTNFEITEKDIPLTGGKESHTEVYKGADYTKF